MTILTSRSRIFVSIDPAQSGSCVALVRNGQRASLILAVSWKKVSRQKIKVYKVDFFDPALDECSSMIIAHPAKISQSIITKMIEICSRSSTNFEDLDVSLSIEDAYIGRSARTGIFIARFAGRMIGVFEGACNSEASWVRPATWRSKILKLPIATKREKAKSASLQYIPLMVDDLDRALTKLGKLDHITDASGIALWDMRK